MLPLLWVVGMLPQVDVLLVYFLEQVQIFCFGGTPAINDFRLFLSFTFSISASIIVSELYKILVDGVRFGFLQHGCL